MDLLLNLLYHNGIQHINIRGNHIKKYKIRSLHFKERHNGFDIVINKTSHNPFGDTHIEVFKKLTHHKGLKYKKTPQTKKHRSRIRKLLARGTRHINKLHKRRSHKRKKKKKQGKRNTRKMVLQKGGINANELIKLICMFCLYFIVTYTTPIISDSEQMSILEYENKFDLVKFEKKISHMNIKSSEKIPVFSKCGEDGICTTKEGLEGPPVFASVSLTKNKDSNLNKFFKAARNLPLLTDHRRGFHQYMRIKNSHGKKLTVEESAKPKDELVRFPKSKTLHNLLEGVVKDKIHAFKQVNMLDDSSKEFCAYAFYNRVKPVSYLYKQFNDMLAPEGFWHHDGIPVKFDKSLEREEQVRDMNADTFNKRSQKDGINEALFSISYDTHKNPDMIQASARILRDGKFGMAPIIVAKDYMGPKSRTLLLDQRVMGKKAFTQHSSHSTNNPKPRVLFGVLIKELKEGMSCNIAQDE